MIIDSQSLIIREGVKGTPLEDKNHSMRRMCPRTLTNKGPLVVGGAEQLKQIFTNPGVSESICVCECVCVYVRIS